MPPVRRITSVDQSADLIKAGIACGRWRGRLPGLRKLSEEFSTSRQTLRLALAQLVREGVLNPGGASESHAVRSDAVIHDQRPRPLRVAILLPRPVREEDTGLYGTMLNLLVRLESDSHECRLIDIPRDNNPDKTLALSRLVGNSGHDLWLVNRGTEETLAWFHARAIPTLAMGGNHRNLPIPAITYDGSANVREGARRLVSLGHRRIVFITPRILRLPDPNPAVIAFREELAGSGIRIGEYHTPDWEESPEGLEALLESLFALTPPTAIICGALDISIGVTAFLARKGLRIPQDISVITSGEESANPWLFPGHDFTRYDDTREGYIKAVRRWVREFGEGRADMKKHLVTGELTEGDTIGPAPSSDTAGSQIPAPEKNRIKPGVFATV